MSVEEQKVAAFVGRLWENPSLAGLSPLQREEQLIQFLDVNSGTLFPTLSSPAFFPGRSWPSIREKLVEALASLSSDILNPLCRGIVEKKMTFSFLKHLAHRSAAPASVQAQLVDFLKKLIGRSDSRMELTGPLMGAGTDIVDRYVDAVFGLQRYVSFELRKVQRLKMEPSEIADLIKATMLLRPAVQYFAPWEQDASSNRKLEHISAAFASKIASEACRTLPLIPEALVKAGISSTLSFHDNPYMECTSRLAAVFARRCRNLKPGMKVDRGAESSDKSWFSVARKNYRFSGFDQDMLAELHSIAMENGW